MQEFKKFISKGNVMEMAVGVIMATYFGAIVKSLVNDILMPPIGMIMGNVDFNDLKIVLQKEECVTYDLRIRENRIRNMSICQMGSA